jgi:hypothetical protein
MFDSNGLAVTGTLSASGITSVTDATDATSTTAASLKTAGGLGVAKKLYVGEGIYGTTDLLLQRSSGSTFQKVARFVNSSTNPLTSAAKGDIVAIGNPGGTSTYLVANDTVVCEIAPTAINANQNIVMASATTLKLGGYTVATLPAAGTAGRIAYVTDATAPTYRGALTGGGAVVCMVFDTGAAWVSV